MWEIRGRRRMDGEDLLLNRIWRGFGLRKEREGGREGGREGRRLAIK
jgi:hypothetical protein